MAIDRLRGRFGTHLVKDIHPGAEGSRISQTFRTGDYAYFGADDGDGIRLWRTDGTPEGTIQLGDLNRRPEEYRKVEARPD